MAPPPTELPERRSERERRIAERRKETRPTAVERRGRPSIDRRSGVEMRGSETVEEHVRNALQLLVSAVETTTLDDDLRRDIDAAAFRLRFAVERMRRGKT